MKNKFLFALILVILSFNSFASSVNINKASAETIATSLIGIGPSKAAAIVEFRTVNGPFKDINELIYVKGIGKKTIEKNKNKIQVISGTP